MTKSSRLKLLLSRESLKKNSWARPQGQETTNERQGRGIRTILGGTPTGSSFKETKTYLREVQNVQISRPLRMIREDEPAITFTDEDAR